MTSENKTTWDGTPVSPERWGKDHLSTLLYIETLCVDGNGRPRADRMRTNRGAPLRGKVSGPPVHFSKDYPTRLRCGTELWAHDDWDCAYDIETFGFIEWKGTGISPVFVMTDAGRELTGRLRRHLSERPSGQRTVAGFKVIAPKEVPGAE